MHKLFKSIDTECEITKGTVLGEIPSWVRGSLYRNAPTKTQFGPDVYNHFFDGMAAIQKFEIKDGQATYQRKFIQSEVLKKTLSVNRIVCTQFGTVAKFPDPCKSLFQRIFSYFYPLYPESDNTPMAIFPVQDRLFACSETNIVNEFDPETLDTLEQVKLNEHMLLDSATAHPHWEEDGTLHGIGYSYSGGNTYNIFKIPAKSDSKGDFSKSQFVVSVPAKNRWKPSYFHSFAMTENFYIFVEQPMVINVMKVLTAKYRGVSIVTCFDWITDAKTQIHIFCRHTGARVNPDFTYEADATFILHHGNAYEENGHIIMDVCAYSDGRLFEFAHIDTFSDPEKMKNHPRAMLNRYVLPISVNAQTERDVNLIPSIYIAEARRVSEQTIHCTADDFSREVCIELPQINYPKYNGKKYRYLYGWDGMGGLDKIHILMKIDMDTREHFVWYEEDCYPSEPVFVQNPDSNNEDGGVVLAAVNSIRDDVSPFLLVLDAASFKEVARVNFPEVDRFARDIHGVFLKEK